MLQANPMQRQQTENTFQIMIKKWEAEYLGVIN